MPEVFVDLELELGTSVPGRDGAPGADGPPGPSGTGPMEGWYNVKDPAFGALGNGTHDDTTAIQNASNAAAAAGGGVVWFPPGVYKTTALITVSSTKVKWDAPSADAVFIKPTNCSGIKWNHGPFTGPMSRPTISDGIHNITIDGTNAGAGAIGLEHGDAIGGRFTGVRIQNFTGAGAIGLRWNTITNYTEGATWSGIVLDNCTTNWVIEVATGAASNSFGYQNVHGIRLTGINSGQVGIVIRKGALVYANEFNVLANLAAGGIFMQIVGNDGTNGFPAGTSGIDGRFNIRAEQTTGAEGGATGIVISAFGQIIGDGVIDLSSNQLHSSIVSGQGTFKVTGHVAAPGLAWNGELGGTIGGSSWPNHGSTATTPPFTNSWVQDGGTVSFWQDASGAVCLQGAVKNGGAGTSAFTLPVGYRPPETLWFAVGGAFGAASAMVTIGTDGTVTCSNATQTSLSGIHFQPVLG